MTPKEFLSQAWHIDTRIEKRLAEIEALEEKRERVMAKVTAGRGTNLSGMPRGGRYDWTDSVERAIEMDRAIKSTIDTIRKDIIELCRVKREVNAAIDAVEDAKYRQVLELRYRNYMTWESIAETMGYDVRWVHRLHGKALQRVSYPQIRH